MRQTTRVGRRRPPPHPAQKEKLLAAYRRSGLTQKVFAAQMGIGYSTLTSWLGKAGASPCARPADAPPALIPVPNLLSGAGRVAAYRLEFAGGLTVEVARGLIPKNSAACWRWSARHDAAGGTGHAHLPGGRRHGSAQEF